MKDADRVDVVDNADAHRFEARIGGQVVAFSEYRRAPGGIVFVHTETDEALEGRGIGSALVAGALDQVRERGLRVTARCPFVAAFLERHREYADLLAVKPAEPRIGAPRDHDDDEAG